jgi:hypothetical protein
MREKLNAVARAGGSSSMSAARARFGWSTWMLCLVLGTLGVLHSQAYAQRIQFSDVTKEKGISFVHENGASGRKFTVETFCGGCGVFDYDGDGDLDLYLVNGAPLPGFDKAVPGNRLYRNEGAASGWSFTDVTDVAGVGDRGYGFGCAVGDYDNDGDLDLYVTNFGPNVLYLNNGDGTFTDVTEKARVGDDRLNTSAAFVDTDQDGDLDLYVCAYTDFDLEDGQVCTQSDGSVIYCGPENYFGSSDILYRNNGDGTFSDVSKLSGIYSEEGKGLGVITTDHDGDGDIDLFVANDLVENFLFENTGEGVFEEIALLSGLAFNESGRPEAGMGVDFADVDGDGLQDVLIGHFDFETSTLYRNEGDGLFTDITPGSGLGPITWPMVTFGLLFVDADNDGDPDVAAANGHVVDNIERVSKDRTYKQRNQVYRNLGGGKFEDATAEAGPGFELIKASRGLAAGDLDRDGDVDLLVLNVLDRADLLRNDLESDHHWISVRTVGGARGISPSGNPGVSNRDGIGARIRIKAGGRTQVRDVHSSASYLSANPMEVHFGLGSADTVDEIEVRWPSGVVDRFEHVAADRMIVVEEGQSRVAR